MDNPDGMIWKITFVRKIIFLNIQTIFEKFK